jgi:apyrase
MPHQHAERRGRAARQHARAASCQGWRAGALRRARPRAQVEKAQAPYLCLDLSFQFALLTHGFKVEAASPVTLVKRVKYQGQEIEAAWPLGAAINLLSS